MIDVNIDDAMTDQLRDMARVLQQPERPLATLGRYLERRWKKSMKNAPRRSIESAREGEPPLSHHGGGGLRGSITSQVRGTTLLVGTNLEYGRIQHEGGVVKMKNKLLTVPLTDDTFDKRAIDMDLRFVPLDGGPSGNARGLLVDEAGEAHWVLMTEVEIRPHPWATFLPEDEAEALAIFEDALDREAGVSG